MPYHLLGPDGQIADSARRGAFGGNRRARIYGQLDCRSANAALRRGYARHRVFFLDERSAIAAGFRPCGHCMRKEYALWKVDKAGQSQHS
jgi:methylphosphotriester-DNA--protein-cysteine methyltransferase